MSSAMIRITLGRWGASSAATTTAGQAMHMQAAEMLSVARSMVRQLAPQPPNHEESSTRRWVSVVGMAALPGGTCDLEQDNQGQPFGKLREVHTLLSCCS